MRTRWLRKIMSIGLIAFASAGWADVTVEFPVTDSVLRHLKTLTLNFTVDGSGNVELDAETSNGNAAPTAVANAWDGSVGTISDPAFYNTNFTLTGIAKLNNSQVDQLSTDADTFGQGLGVTGARVNGAGTEEIIWTYDGPGSLSFKSASYDNRALTADSNLTFHDSNTSNTVMLPSGSTNGTIDLVGAGYSLISGESFVVTTAQGLDTAAGANFYGFSFEIGLILTDPYQHLDASVASSVLTDGTGAVTNWLDISGSAHHAVPDSGPQQDSAPLFPSASLSGTGLEGVDMRTNRAAFRLFTAAEAESLFDFTGAASSNNGLTVIAAFKADSVSPSFTTRDLVLGNAENIQDFQIRYDGGPLKAFLDGQTFDSGYTVVAGDTIIVGMKYSATSGEAVFWNSQNMNYVTNTLSVAGNLGAGDLRLGGSSNGSQYFDGMIGEVKLFSASLSAAEFEAQLDLLINKWTDSSMLAPNPADFAVKPVATNMSSISMTAQTGVARFGPVEYYFAEVSGQAGGTDSGWQTSPSYTDEDLSPGVEYTYTVQMRDARGSNSVVSVEESEKTLMLDFATLDPATLGQLAVGQHPVPSPDGGYIIYSADVTDYGALEGVAQDNTAAFQSALNAVYADGGGTVFVPDGVWHLYGSLYIPDGVTLCGVWDTPDAVTSETLLLVHAGHATTNGAFMTIGNSAGVHNMSFYYPEQDINNVVPYPPTLLQPSKSAASAINLTLYNPYTGIRISDYDGEASMLCTVHDIFMSPLKMGISRGRVSDVPRIYRINIGARYWPMLDDGAAEALVKTYMRANTTGIEYGWQSIINLNDAIIEDCASGVSLVRIPGLRSDGVLWELAPAQCGFCNTLITNCVVGVDILDMTDRFDIADSTIDADTPIVISDVVKGSVSLNNCQLSGTNTLIISYSEQNDAINMISCYNTTFSRPASTEPVIDYKNGTVDIVNCNFGSGPHLKAGDDVVGVRLAANICSGGSFVTQGSVTNSSRYHEQNWSDTPPLQPAVTQGYDFPSTPQAGTTNLVNVRIDYGATGDGVSNDTSAFKNALAYVAGLGGGTVYVPPGAYRIQQNINIPDGVELRGCFAAPHHTRDVFGSIIYAAPTSQPLLKPAANAGIRGLSIYYPEQGIATNDIVAYPYAIKLKGQNAWVKDVSFINAYNGIDAGSYKNTSGHYLSGIWGNMMHEGIYLGSTQGSTSGWVENCHIISHFWFWHPLVDLTSEQKAEYKDYLIKNATVFKIGGVANEQLYSNFAMDQHTIYRFVKQNGRSPNLTMWLGSSDYTEFTFVFEAADEVNIASCSSIPLTTGLVMEDTVQGTVRLVNSGFIGQPTDHLVDIRGGTYEMLQGSLRMMGQSGIEISAGNAFTAGVSFRRDGTCIDVLGGDFYGFGLNRQLTAVDNTWTNQTGGTLTLDIPYEDITKWW